MAVSEPVCLRPLPWSLSVRLCTLSTRIAGLGRRLQPQGYEVNFRVAEHHNLNGWDREPPFFADYTSSTPVSYLDLRDSSLLDSLRAPDSGKDCGR